jgi:hypothetical protein
MVLSLKDNNELHLYHRIQALESLLPSAAVLPSNCCSAVIYPIHCIFCRLGFRLLFELSKMNTGLSCRWTGSTGHFPIAFLGVNRIW